MIAASLVSVAATVGVVATALVAIAAVIEKVFSPAGKWLQRWLTTPMAREVAKVAEEQTKLAAEVKRLQRNMRDNHAETTDHIRATQRNLSEARAELEEHRTYTYYHLGPNGTATPVHRRLERLEKAHDIEDD